MGAGALTSGLLAGCDWLRSDPPPPVPDPLDQFIWSTQELAQRYESTLTAYPELTERLGPLHATHVAHLAALRDVVGRDPAPPSPTNPAGTFRPAPGQDPDTAVVALREAEEAAQAEAAQACLAAPPARALLLGTITAARASHVSVLS